MYTSGFTSICWNFVTPRQPCYGPLWMCWHQVKSNEPVFNKITFNYVSAFQVVTVWCDSNDISVVPNICGALASECPQIRLLATKENQSQLLTFVFSKQHLLSCLVHYFWFRMTLGYFQNYKPFSKDSIVKEIQKFAIGSEKNPTKILWRDILQGVLSEVKPWDKELFWNPTTWYLHALSVVMTLATVTHIVGYKVRKVCL